MITRWVVYRGGIERTRSQAAHVLVPILGALLCVASHSARAHSATDDDRSLDARFKELFNRRFGNYDTQVTDARTAACNRLAQARQLRETEMLAIYSYTSSGYSAVNHALRMGVGQELDELTPFVDALNSALDKLEDYRGAVFRITNLPPSVLASHVPGADVLYPAFTSTYRTLTFMPDFPVHPHAFYIQSRTGKDVTACSWFKDQENEVLFRSHTRFRIDDRVEANDGTIVFKMSEE
jgi:hypothetical protein